MEIKIIEKEISLSELKKMADDLFSGELVKAVVDVEKEIMAVGGAMHVDEEQVLLENDSKQMDLWGINVRFDKERPYWIEFDSMINVRPVQNNRSRSVEDKAIQEKIKEIVKKLIKEDE